MQVQVNLPEELSILTGAYFLRFKEESIENSILAYPSNSGVVRGHADLNKAIQHGNEDGTGFEVWRYGKGLLTKVHDSSGTKVLPNTIIVVGSTDASPEKGLEVVITDLNQISGSLYCNLRNHETGEVVFNGLLQNVLTRAQKEEFNLVDPVDILLKISKNFGFYTIK